jgi:hypothetical protein
VFPVYKTGGVTNLPTCGKVVDILLLFLLL